MSLNELTKQQRFTVSGVMFLTIIPIAVGLLMYTVIRFVPPPPVPPGMASMPQQPSKKMTYLQRLFNNAKRGLRQPAGGKQRLQETVRRTVRSSAPRSSRMTVRDPQRMRYRQSLIAHQILTRYEGEPAENALERVKRIAGNGAWRTYELARLKVRILGDEFDKNKDVGILPEYKRFAVRTADSKFSNFEDYLFAGHACLCSKDVNKAEEYLLKAWNTWPAKDDMSGFCYLFLTCIAGIRNNTDATLERIEGFQENFPDWLYSEIYLPEFEFLEKAYPDAPLIKVFHARVLSLVSNDAQALSLFGEALRHPALDRDARQQISKWMQEIRAHRNGKEG